MTQSKAKPSAAHSGKNTLNDLGYKIFLDRYAVKDMTRSTLKVGDRVIVLVNPATGQREVGTVTAMALPNVTVELLDGTVTERTIEQVDKPLETEPGQMLDRVARGLASVEKTAKARKEWQEKFRWLLDDFRFVPAGRILAAAGTDAELTFYNCYVIPSPKDSRGGIIETLRQMTEIMSRGGGVGINISSLRPHHAYVKGVNGRSSGAVSWGALYSFVTGLIEQGGSRRGALMLILDDWHPDVFNFINSKREAGRITNANISVGISDRLMEAVRDDGEWELKFPDTTSEGYDEHWNGDIDAWIAAGRPVVHYRTIRARELWNAIIESAWASAEPGVFFRERYNKMSNSHYYAPIISTNPCVTGDTRISTGRGMITARELFDSEQPVEVAIDGRFGVKQTLVPASRVFRTGRKAVCRLQTTEGYFLRATADHRVMTPAGWVEIGQLQPGDRLHIFNRRGGFGAGGTLELGRVLGWMVGDRAMPDDKAALSFSAQEKHEPVPLTAGDRAYPIGVQNTATRDAIRVESTLLLEGAQQNGLATNRFCVPESVFQGSEEMQRGFLQALFTANGTVLSGDDKGGSVRLASRHIGLLEGVQQLLLNFGIASRICRNGREVGGQMLSDAERQTQHELAITEASMRVFADEIGFILSDRQEQLSICVESRDVHGLYSEKFVAQVESVTDEGVEEVFDLTEPLTHSFIANQIVVHNCGEQGLPGFGVCNLGAINLARFYDAERHDVLWDDLDRAVRYATRFLDNVVEVTPYFFEENERQQKGERRVGLNNMGLAELMIRLGIRYGSDESLAFIDRLYSFIARASYETSIELAQERGAFPMFDAEQFLASGFMQTMPQDIREKVRRHGIRNVTLLTQAPTGCVAPDTLVSTATGLQPIVTMGDPSGQQWQVITGKVQTDAGLRAVSHFYVNGKQPVKRLTTGRGFSITATCNHRLRVIDADGRYVWRRMDEMRLGDQVVLKKNTLGEGAIVPLTPVDRAANSGSELPATMTEDFAELLGFYMGDGCVKKRGGLHIAVSGRDSDLLEYLPALMRRVWGADRVISQEERPGCYLISLTGCCISRFLEANGMKKPTGNRGEGAAGAFIPEAVLRAGRGAVRAFLRGLFESDGCITRGTITLNSVSLALLRQVQTALLGLGVVASIRPMPHDNSHLGKRTLYELRVLNRREMMNFSRQVGFISQRKRALLEQQYPMSDHDDHVDVMPLVQGFYAASQGMKNASRQIILQRISSGALTQQFVSEMMADHPQPEETGLGQPVRMDIFLDRVEAIEDDECETFDISVPDNHTYIANGFVSHNTTGTMVNTSTGIEPFFSWKYYRRSRLGLHEENAQIVQEWFDAHPGETELPDYFVTAMELTPEEHVRVQAAIQRWVDSSISKTANVPNHYTVEQTRELYEYMYELGCKGGTIYRDGSRDEQVLMLKVDDEKKAEAPKAESAPVAQVATPHRVYPRPNKLQGVTVNTNTPYGTAYITMNSDEQGKPFEVFIVAPGKAGSDLQADAEGLGRMISLQLRTTAPENRLTMLRLIIDQLQGIGGSRSVGFGVNRIMSLPDAVAQALMDNYFPEDKAQQLSLFQAQFDTPAAPQVTAPASIPAARPASASARNGTNGLSKADVLQQAAAGNIQGAELCPSCHNVSLVRAEGCKTCLRCGFSEC